MISNDVRLYRIKLKATQAEVSVATGIPRTNLSLMENGRLLPTAAKVKALAKYFGVTCRHLYSDKQLAAIFENSEEEME